MTSRTTTLPARRHVLAYLARGDTLVVEAGRLKVSAAVDDHWSVIPIGTGQAFEVPSTGWWRLAADAGASLTWRREPPVSRALALRARAWSLLRAGAGSPLRA